MSKRTAERKRLIGLYGQLYSRHTFEHAPGSCGCYYCGDFPGTVDHVPPLSWVDAKKPEDWKAYGYQFLLVPSCQSCNSILGDKPLFTLKERADFVEGKLLDKYEKQMALWSEEEIAEMSPQFQKVILAKKAQALELLERSRYAQWRAMQDDVYEVI